MKRDSGRASPYRVPGMEEEWRARLKRGWRFTHPGHSGPGSHHHSVCDIRVRPWLRRQVGMHGWAKRGHLREATAADRAEVEQISPRCCPGWGWGATRAGARHQLVSDPLNQSVELAIECGVDRLKGQREVVRIERATSRGRKDQTNL